MAHDCARRVYTIYQKPVETIDDYFDHFRETWNTTEAAGGNKILVPDLLSGSSIYGVMGSVKLKEAAMAIFTFLHTDRIRFGNKIRRKYSIGD